MENQAGTTILEGSYLFSAEPRGECHGRLPDDGWHDGMNSLVVTLTLPPAPASMIAPLFPPHTVERQASRQPSAPVEVLFESRGNGSN